ncbi:ribonuclease H family protein [Plebeiibacterium sediminum]|uniref:ribonuclease H n=1 Tax=Plebeiibacterium sediminum TaxID=2992112 RepID=A0AAE3M826_9BACT|nr:ribonuclease H [Plebeiobacterium sediminum]MCW3788813.1 ribonuclease HI [Plebeiobacterium sediminum]
MKSYRFAINITTVQESMFTCLVTDGMEHNELEYYYDNKSIVFAHKNNLSDAILNNTFQFNKVISSALKGTLTVGHTIHCVFIDGFPFIKEADFSGIIEVDRRQNDLIITPKQTESKGFHKLYTDGSFHSPSGHSGIGGIIEDTNGVQEAFSYSFKEGSSILMELLAVKKGLEQLRDIIKIQIFTDSRYVIRGLVQWIHFWKLNDWQTAHGKKVKFAKLWQETDELCNGKIMQFKWIKGHVGHKEQSHCHNLAKESARGTNK